LKTGLKGGLKGAVAFPPRLLKLIAASLIVPLASLINPYGLKLAIFPFIHQSVDNSDALRHINEWARIPLKDLLLNLHPYPINFFSFRVLLFAAAALLILNYKRIRSRDLMIFAAAFYMASEHVRWVPLFAYFAAPVIAYNAAAYMDSMAHPLMERRLKAGALLISVFVAIFMIRGYSNAAAMGRYGLGIKNGTFPEGTVEFMKRNELKANIYNEYVFGGYIIFNLPGNKVFIDGRTPTVYSPYFYWTSRLINDLTRWNRLVKEHDIRAAFLKTKSTFCNQLHEEEGWAAVYFDDVSVLYLRRGAGFDDMISKRAFEKLNLCTDQGRYRLPEDEAGLLKARRELRDFLDREKSAGRFAVPHRLLGIISTELGGDYLDEALEELKKAESIRKDPYISYDTGLALVKLERYDSAIDAFRKAVAKDKGFKDPYLAMGLLYFDIEDYEKSVKTLDKYFLIAGDKSEHSAYKSHGMSCFWLSRFDCAVASLKRAAFTTEDRKELGNLYYYIGNALFEAGDFDEGVKYYALAIDVEPEYAAVLSNVAANLAKDGDRQAARKLRGLLSGHPSMAADGSA
jgi:tetratricopeptide (TPR) repeat protein